MKPKTKPINTTDHKSVAFIASERAYKSLYQIFRLNMFYCLVFIFISLTYLVFAGIYRGVGYIIVTLWLFLFIKDYVPVYYRRYKDWKIQLFMTLSLLFLFLVVIPILFISL